MTPESERSNHIIESAQALPVEQQLILIRELAQGIGCEVVAQKTIQKEIVIRALEDLIHSHHQATTEKSHGRPPIRLSRILEAYRGCDDPDNISLAHFTKYFSNTSLPRQNASNALSWLGSLLEETNSPIELQSDTVFRFVPRKNPLE